MQKAQPNVTERAIALLDVSFTSLTCALGNWLLLMKSEPQPASFWLPFCEPALTQTSILSFVNHSGATCPGEPRHIGDENLTSRCQWLPQGSLSRTRWRSLITRVCRFYVTPPYRSQSYPQPSHWGAPQPWRHYRRSLGTSSGSGRHCRRCRRPRLRQRWGLS